MKKHKMIMAAITVAAVALVFLLFSGHQQNDVQPTAANQAPIATKPTAAPEKIHPKSPAPAADFDIAEKAAEDRKEKAPHVTEAFGDHVGGAELRPIEAQELSVDWQAAAEHPPLVTDQLSDEQQQAINEAAVPVLLPDDPQMLSDTVLTNGEYYYAASMSEDDVSILANTLVSDRQGASGAGHPAQ